MAPAPVHDQYGDTSKRNAIVGVEADCQEVADVEFPGSRTEDSEPGSTPTSSASLIALQEDAASTSSDDEFLYVSLTCADCVDLFPTRAELLAHRRRAHPDRRPYQCPECMAALRSLEMLVLHKSTHTQIRPFACSHCARLFSRRSHVQAHERALHLQHHARLAHQDDALLREHRCLACGDRVFNTASGLAGHRTKCHSEELPFECKVCKSKFKLRSTMNRHVKKLHEKQPASDIISVQ